MYSSAVMDKKTTIFVSLCFLSSHFLVESIDAICIENGFASKGPLLGSIATYQDGYIDRIDLSFMKSGKELKHQFLLLSFV